MEELLPNINIKAGCDSKLFIKSIYELANKKTDIYKIVYEKAHFFSHYESDYLELMPVDQNGHENIFAQLFSIPEKEDIVQVEIRAPRWKVEPVTCDMYITEARRILFPLLNEPLYGIKKEIDYILRATKVSTYSNPADHVHSWIVLSKIFMVEDRIDRPQINAFFSIVIFFFIVNTILFYT